jgi:arginyl-tRNA synthetase
VAFGIKVNREYYINDGGNQIEKLGLSTLIRYKQSCGQTVDLPEDSYHGEEIVEIANRIKTEKQEQYINATYDDNKITDTTVAEFFKSYAKKYLLDVIKQTLINFGVQMDIWFSESSIYENKLIDITLQILAKHIYKKDGAT